MEQSSGNQGWDRALGIRNGAELWESGLSPLPWIRLMGIPLDFCHDPTPSGLESLPSDLPLLPDLFLPGSSSRIPNPPKPDPKSSGTESQNFFPIFGITGVTLPGKKSNQGAHGFQTELICFAKLMEMNFSIQASLIWMKTGEVFVVL